jgi:hypothetical protein
MNNSSSNLLFLSKEHSIIATRIRRHNRFVRTLCQSCLIKNRVCMMKLNFRKCVWCVELERIVNQCKVNNRDFIERVFSSIDMTRLISLKFAIKFESIEFELESLESEWAESEWAESEWTESEWAKSEWTESEWTESKCFCIFYFREWRRKIEKSREYDSEEHTLTWSALYCDREWQYFLIFKSRDSLKTFLRELIARDVEDVWNEMKNWLREILKMFEMRWKIDCARCWRCLRWDERLIARNVENVLIDREMLIKIWRVMNEIS